MNCCKTILYLDSEKLDFSKHQFYFQIASEVVINDTIFTWNERMLAFCPIRGEFLGIDIQPYSWNELIYLCKDYKQIILHYNYCFIARELDLFTDNEYIYYTDYSKLITVLEERKMIKTRETENLLATDLREFQFENEWYLVDILGTALFPKITQQIIDLYEK
jgi:hypothetical protein